MGLLILGFCTVSALMLWELRRETWDTTMRGSQNLLAAISQDIGRNLEIYGLSLQAAVDGMNRPDVLAAAPEIQDAILYDRATTARYLNSILVLDENGTVIGDSRSRPPRQVNVSDRDYFTVHRDRSEVGLYLSLPFRSRLSGDDILGVSLRRNHPDGSFAGVVLGTIQLNYFRELFARFNLGPEDAVNLFRMDGTLLARVPDYEGHTGRNIAGAETFRRFVSEPRGEFVATSAIDGVERAYVFEHVRGFPLIVDVALSVKDIYSGWRSKALVLASVLALLCGASVGLGLMLRQEFRRRRKAEAAALLSGEQYRLLADNASDLIIRFDAQRVAQYVSPGSRSLGFNPEELKVLWSVDLVHRDDVAIAEDPWEVAQEDGRSEATYRLQHKDGHYVWMEAQFTHLAEAGGFAMVARDISKRKFVERKLHEANRELARLASTDGLTGLCNRRAFDEHLQREWRRAIRQGSSLALVMLDADHFKAYNDHYGHQGGDDVLRAIAQALEDATRRPSDYPARYGGEEFVAILPYTGLDGAAEVAERIRLAVQELHLPHDRSVKGFVSVSVGVAATAPLRGQDPAPLLAAADAALYEAKAAGRDTVRLRALSVNGGWKGQE